MNAVIVGHEEALMEITQHPRPRWVCGPTPSTIRRDISDLTLNSTPVTPLFVLAVSLPAILGPIIQKG